MFKNILSNSVSSPQEFLQELKNNIFNEVKINQLYKNSNIDLNWRNENGETLLHTCCKGNYYQAVKWLVDNGADIEAKTKDGSTPIFYSIYSKDRSIINLLIENNANINHLNNFKRTVLQEAVISASNKFIDLLISKTKNLNNCDTHGNNLIFDAIANGGVDIIDKIAQNKEININQVNLEGNTILHKEVVLKNTQLAMNLLEYGADPTILDKQGKNFLFYAVSKGYKNIDIFHKAIEMGCNLNSRSSDNTTILMESINYFLAAKDNKEERDNHFNMISELIKLGVNTSAVDDNNENALFKATRSFDEELIDLFLEDSKININHKNIHGETVLSILIYNGLENIHLIKKFLENDANPNIRDAKGRTLVENLLDAVLYFHNNKEIDLDLEKKLNRNGEYLTVLTAVLNTGKVDMEQLTSLGEPLFFQSIFHFNFKLFKLLKVHDIDINQKDINGNNIIFKIMEKQEPETRDELKMLLSTMKSLITMGVNINVKNNEGQTILHKALLEKNEYVLKLLIEAKANIAAKDKQGRTIAHLVILKNKPLRFLKLIDHYDKNVINMPDRYGVKPLNYAAFMGKKEFIIYMLEHEILVNNTETIDPEMIKFFIKFHKNIINLPNFGDTEVDKVNLKLLKDAMMKEFNIKE